MKSMTGAKEVSLVSRVWTSSGEAAAALVAAAWGAAVALAAVAVAVLPDAAAAASSRTARTTSGGLAPSTDSFTLPPCGVFHHPPPAATRAVVLVQSLFFVFFSPHAQTTRRTESRGRGACSTYEEEDEVGHGLDVIALGDLGQLLSLHLRAIIIPHFSQLHYLRRARRGAGRGYLHKGDDGVGTGQFGEDGAHLLGRTAPLRPKVEHAGNRAHSSGNLGHLSCMNHCRHLLAVCRPLI